MEFINIDRILKIRRRCKMLYTRVYAQKHTIFNVFQGNTYGQYLHVKTT